MRVLTYQEQATVSAGETEEYETDPYLLSVVLLMALSVGTVTACAGYNLTMHGSSWGWRISALLGSFYGGFTLGSLAGAGTLLSLAQIEA